MNVRNNCLNSRIKTLLILLATVAVLASCKDTPTPVTPDVTARPYSDSTKPRWIKITLYDCPSSPVLYADIAIRGDTIGRLSPGKFLVAYVEPGIYSVMATPNAGRPQVYAIDVSTNSGEQFFNCFD